MNEVPTTETGNLAVLNRSEIDMQIATAQKFPRSIKRFLDEALQMVTLNENIAQECIYSLPRDGKNIEGASARFAEIIASAWRNSRAGARVISDTGDFVTAQGVFHDLERNVAITYEVQRRITNRNGQRFSADMIGVTANAACSIALRNAILKGVPKAFWSDLYAQAREAAIGNVQTLANRRARALVVLQKYGVTREQVLAFLKIQGEEDITLDHLATLFGITTALKEGDTTPEQAFNIGGSEETGKTKTPPAYSDEAFEKDIAKWQEQINKGKATPEKIIAMVSSKNTLTTEQADRIRAMKKQEAPPTASGITYAEVADKLNGAKNQDELDLAGSLIGDVADADQQTELRTLYTSRRVELEGA
jgi:hypothetical protein